ncbi:MAG: fatty acid desaturase [Polyangiaceae bacterium]
MNETALPPIDYEAFARDLDALRREIDANLGPEDLAHMQKIERWGRWCTWGGYATAWIAPNPISAFLLAQGTTARWTMMMHHVGHKGYDRVPNVPERYTSKVFALGSRRYIDWLDWILPEAWHHEHNILHHYRTGELADPDMVEEHMKEIREANLPMAIKYAIAGFYACTWKLTYYAPNTLQVLRRARKAKEARENAAASANDDASAEGPKDRENYEEPLASSFNPFTAEGREFFTKCFLPYGLVRFGLLPALYAPLGLGAVTNVLLNTLGAEVITNLHSFAVIAPNHAGDDLYRFDTRSTDRAEFCVRQVIGSVNFRTGGDVNDFLHGWLNYQIEHHVWPDLPMLRYQQVQPKVKEICEKHGVPYVQESVFKRVGKLLDIMVGKSSMLRTTTLSKAARVKAAREAMTVPAVAE